MRTHMCADMLVDMLVDMFVDMLEDMLIEMLVDMLVEMGGLPCQPLQHCIQGAVNGYGSLIVKDWPQADTDPR